MSREKTYEDGVREERARMLIAFDLVTGPELQDAIDEVRRLPGTIDRDVAVAVRELLRKAMVGGGREDCADCGAEAEPPKV